MRYKSFIDKILFCDIIVIRYVNRGMLTIKKCLQVTRDNIKMV